MLQKLRNALDDEDGGSSEDSHDSELYDEIKTVDFEAFNETNRRSRQAQRPSRLDSLKELAWLQQTLREAITTSLCAPCCLTIVGINIYIYTYVPVASFGGAGYPPHDMGLTMEGSGHTLIIGGGPH